MMSASTASAHRSRSSASFPHDPMMRRESPRSPRSPPWSPAVRSYRLTLSRPRVRSPRDLHSLAGCSARDTRSARIRRALRSPGIRREYPDRRRIRRGAMRRRVLSSRHVPSCSHVPSSRRANRPRRLRCVPSLTCSRSGPWRTGPIRPRCVTCRHGRRCLVPRPRPVPRRSARMTYPSLGQSSPSCDPLPCDFSSR